MVNLGNARSTQYRHQYETCMASTHTIGSDVPLIF